LTTANPSPSAHVTADGETIPGPDHVHMNVSGPSSSSLSTIENVGDTTLDGELNGDDNDTDGACADASRSYVATPAELTFPNRSVATTDNV
jgi:hypothetical protein